MDKKLKPLTDEDIAACEPEAIWLETRKVPIPAYTVLWLLIILLLAAGIWATFAQVDQTVVAEGKLVTTRPNITLKPLENSLVDKILVKPGQRVQAGEELITFDTTINLSKIEQQQSLFDSKRAEILRLEAERQQASSFSIPQDLKEHETAQQQVLIFDARRHYYEGKIRYYEQYMARYKKMADSLEESLSMYKERQTSMLRIEKMYQDLAEKKSVPLKDALEVQMQRLANEIEIENQRANLVSYRQSILQAEAERDVFIAEWQQGVSKDLVEAQRELLGHEDALKMYTLLYQQNALKSPCEAIVHEVAPYQDGSGVREAEALITLVPIDVPLEAEIDIQPLDIGRIRLGDLVRIKLDAFPFQQHGTLTGRVLNISADTHESKSNFDQSDLATTATGGSRPQFRARLGLSGHLTGVNDSYWQLAGMKLRAEVKVGERSVIQYILNPFLKSLDESIREP